MTSKGTPVVPMWPTLPMLAVVALLLPLACSGGMAAAPGDDRLFVPEDLPNTPRAGEVGVTLKLVASTLVQGATAAEHYAAVRNDGKTPSCEAGLMIDFIDKAGQPVMTSAAACYSNRLYRLDDGADHHLHRPGPDRDDRLNRPPRRARDRGARVYQHRFPTFTVVDAVVPVDAVTVGEVTTVSKGRRERLHRHA